jgi:L-lactate dehydrogenase complex protein LldG
MNTQELAELMTQRAQAVQTVVVRCADWPAAIRYAVEVTAAQGGRTVAPWAIPEDMHRLLVESSAEKGLAVLDPPFHRHGQEIHTALTTADWGIAETGTVVLDSTEEDCRIATMLSETHVVVLPESRLRLSAFETAQAIKAWHHDPPRYVAFISGASRTADIERVLTIGVHGPQQMHLLLLQEAQS